jgi:hypothetical protein
VKNEPPYNIAEIMQRPLPDCALQVSSARDFGIIENPASGPMVAFTQLAFSPAGTDYLESLSFGRHYNNLNNHPHISRHKPEWFERQFIVAGWHHDPLQSTAAKQRFMRLAGTVLPAIWKKDEGRTNVLITLAEHYANLAAGLDRHTLPFQLRAIGQAGNQSNEHKLHCDPKSQAVSIAYLVGCTTPHANPQTYTAADFERPYDQMGPSETDMLTITPTIAARLYATPTRSASIWRAESWGKPSPHHTPVCDDDLRVVMLTDITKMNAALAYRIKPTLRQRLSDWHNSNFYQSKLS